MLRRSCSGVLVAVLASCSPPTGDSNKSSVAPAATGMAAAPAIAPPSGNASPSPSVTPIDPPSAGPPLIALTGLGTLRIGQPVPASGGWAERGAQAGATCRTITSQNFPGVYAIVVKDIVRRITVGQRSNVRLVEGIGIGSPESKIDGAFSGFRIVPHAYQPAPAKYLTAPTQGRNGSDLRFEIDRTGRVELFHVGLAPELSYVEGCA